MGLTALKRVLFDKAITQHALAGTLGVSQNTIWRWANGWKSLPQDRALQLAGVLGVAPSTFDDMVSSETKPCTFKRSEPVTMLDWLLQNVLSGDAAGYRRAAEGLANTAGVRPFEVRDWITGARRIPLEAAVKFKSYHFNPALLCYEVSSQRLAAEDEAVSRLVADLARKSPESFTELVDVVGAARYTFSEGEQGGNVDKIFNELDNGETINDYLLEVVEGFHNEAE